MPHHHRHEDQQAGALLGLLLIAVMLGSPFLLAGAILFLPFVIVGVAITLPFMFIGAAMAISFVVCLNMLEILAAPMHLTATAASASVSIPALAVGALALYATIGAAYLFSAAKESFKTDHSIWDVLKSRVAHSEGFSFKGVVNSVGAVLWSPFLVLGGLAGKGAKAVAHVFESNSKEAPAPTNPKSKMESQFAALHAKQAPKGHVPTLVDEFEAKSHTAESRQRPVPSRLSVNMPTGPIVRDTPSTDESDTPPFQIR